MSHRTLRRLLAALACLALASVAPAFLSAVATAATWQVVRDAPRVNRYTPFVDPLRHRLFVLSDIGLEGDPEVWSLSLDSLAQWRQENAPRGHAALRESPSLIPDPARDRVLAFGGNTLWSQRRSNDLWSFDVAAPANWRQLSHDENGPILGNSGSAVLDTRRNRMIAFGGEFTEGASTLATNRTWEFGSLARWDEVLAAGPPSARGWAAAAYDSLDDRLVVTGGFAGLAPPLTDTWELKFPGNVWRRLPDAGAAAPSATSAYSWASKTSRTLGLFEPTTLWSLDLARSDAAVWSARPIPVQASPSWGQPAWDDATQSLWQFDQESGDLWRLSSSGTPTWSIALDVPAPPPARRDGASIVFDPTTDRTYVLFGRDATGLATTGAEVHGGSLRGWRPLAVTPSPRRFATTVMDEPNNRILVHGGYEDGTGAFLSDLWEYRTDTGTWNRLAPSGDAPGPRAGHSAVIDPEGRRMIVFGGTSWMGDLADTWSLALDGPPRWTRLQDAPVARGYHAAAWDVTRRQMLIVRANQDYTRTEQTPEVWLWSPDSAQAWRSGDTYGTVEMLPPLLVFPDLSRQRLIVMGSSNRSRSPVLTYQLDLSTMTWRPYQADHEPLNGYFARVGFADHVRGRAVLLQESSTGGAEVWTLPLDDPPGTVARPFPATVAAEQVEVSWRLGGDRLPLRLVIEQKRAGTRTVGLVPTGDVVRYVDTQMTPNDTVSYTVQSSTAGEWTSLNTINVPVPRPTPSPYSLGMWPVSPSVGSQPRIRISLPDRQPARLEVFDVSGRRLASQDVARQGPGEHTIRLQGSLHPGMYLVRLTHAQRVLHGRLVVVSTR